MRRSINIKARSKDTKSKPILRNIIYEQTRRNMNISQQPEEMSHIRLGGEGDIISLSDTFDELLNFQRAAASTILHDQFPAR